MHSRDREWEEGGLVFIEVQARAGASDIFVFRKTDNGRLAHGSLCQCHVDGSWTASTAQRRLGFAATREQGLALFVSEGATDGAALAFALAA